MPDHHPNPRPRYRFGRTLVALLIIPTVVGTLLGFAGSLWWVIDLFSHFRLQYALILGAGVLLAVVLRAWRLVALAAAGLAINLAVIAPLYVPRDVVADADAPPLKIIAFNVYTQNKERDAAIAWMLDQEADLVLVQEVGPDWHIDLKLKMAIAGYSIARIDTRGDNFGIALLVRDDLDPAIRVTGAKRTYAADGEVPAIEATIDWSGRRVRFLGLHTLPPVSPTYARTRDAQLSAVGQWVKRQDGPVIVAGDLNATPWSAAVRRLMSETELVNSQRGFGVQPSWPARGFGGMIPIDHCLHSGELVAVSRQLGERRGSDHLPIVVTLRWAVE